MLNIKSQNRLSLSLMIGSLIVLMIFQGFWLVNEYEQEKLRFQHEADRMFMNSVRSIEDSLFNEVLVQPFIFSLENNKDNKDTSRFPNHLDMMTNRLRTQKTWSDSSAKVTITGTFDQDGFKENPIIGKNDTSIRFMFRSKSGTKGGANKHSSHKESGNISLFIALSDIEKKKDSLFPDIEQTPIKAMLEKNFELEMKESDLPVHYKILETAKNDSTIFGLVSSHYTDLPSEHNYFVQFPEYRGYVIQKIIPQLLFSLFLFFCIALAYFIIYRSLQKQKRLNELKNDFISNITHELKTPITTVGVAIEAMRNFHALQNLERTREYLDISKQELSRLSLLVDKVLKMSMFEHAEPQLKIEFLDMKELIEQILNSMKIQFEKLGAELIFHSSEGNFEVRGDRTHLTSVAYNLIDNALKYRSQNPVIEINLEDIENQIQLSVSDNGPGIPMEYQEKIFEKFFRVPTGNQHNTKGYGLGLAYVAGVIDKHNGTIQVKSQLGGGTRFTIDLPKAHG